MIKDAVLKKISNAQEKDIDNQKKDKRNSFKRLVAYAGEYRIMIAFVIFFALIQTLAGVASPKVAGMAITVISAGISGGVAAIDFDHLFKILAFLLVLYSVFSLSLCAGSYLITNITVKMTWRLRENISRKMNCLKISYLESTGHGDILSRVMNDVDVLSSAFTQSISQIISSVVTAVGVLFMMFYISWELSVLYLLIIPVMAVAVFIILKKSQKYFVEYQSSLGKINGFIEENFSGHEVIKSFGAEERVKEGFYDRNVKIYNLMWKSQFFSGFTSPVMSFISNFSYIVSCAVGGYFAVVRAFTIGDISAFIAYSGQFTQPLVQVSGILSMIQQTLAASDRIFEFLDAPEEQAGSFKALYAGGPELLKGAELKHDIEFKDISFGYNAENIMIKNFSFKITPGQSVAVVGETGAGKTTLIKLLMRFYSVLSGEILLGSKNINEFELKDYRKLFAVVTQDSWLHKDTIAENIRYGNLKASDEEVRQAAKFVGLDHFISSLPRGYETVIDEGASNISEGQKQLICIARMVISDSPVFILDEATASVDTCTESRIQSVLNKVLKNKTSIIIAHRLSTVKNSDVILVMSKGELVEHGTHSELLKKKGLYYDLYASQFENAG